MKKTNIIKILILMIVVLCISANVFAATNVSPSYFKKGDKLKFTGYAWTIYRTEAGAKALNHMEISGYLRNNQIITIQSVSGNVLKIGDNKYISYGSSAMHFFTPVNSGARTLQYKFKIGDVSGNKLVNSYDAGMILQHSVGKMKLSVREQLRADINNNGIITSEDARLAAQEKTGTRRIKYVPGDLDGDKIVSYADARLLSRYMSGLENLTLRQKLAVDLDGDDQITYADSRLLSRYLSGLIKVFPIEGDIDGNGRLDQNDSNLLLKSSVRLVVLNDAQKRCGDTDNDGQITSEDARVILRRSAGL